MKIVVISDPHVVVRGERVRSIETAQRLDICVSKINELAHDADLCVVLGDNVQIPSTQAYETFFECLRPLKMPIRCLIGNHDDRTLFRKMTPDVPVDENGFIQSSIAVPDGVLLFLDTHRPGSEIGDYGSEKLAWLKKVLTDTHDRPVYIFMHHPPFRLGFSIDHTMVEQFEAFQQTIRAAGNVRHIFLGHTHRASSGNWNGITWTTMHGLAYQSDFELLPAKPNYRSGPAQIGILLLNDGESVLHFQDILDPYPVISFSGQSRRAPTAEEAGA